MKTATTVIACVAALLFLGTTVSMPTPADAGKRMGKVGKIGKIGKVPKLGKHVGHGKVARHAAKDMRYAKPGRYYRAGRWADGIWIGTGLATGVAVVTKSCNHYYKRWQASGDPKWRNRYNACVS